VNYRNNNEIHDVPSREEIAALMFQDFLLKKEKGCSVTRFGEISPLGQTFKNVRQTFEGLFIVWQNS